MKYYKLIVFLILAVATIVANYFNITPCITGSTPSIIGFISSIVFIGAWIGLGIISTYKNQKWFIVFSVLYWIISLGIYIQCIYWDRGNSIALSTSPLNVIPIYGMTYLNLMDSVILASRIMIIIPVVNIIAYLIIKYRDNRINKSISNI
ncbi:MAG: hypothetical protein RR840_06130 [Clostridium sp.]